MNNPVVLIVDDQELNRTLFESMLREDGYRTRTAASGQAALEAVETELPDLILLDLVMPGIGGLDVIQRLKAQERSRVIPIVVITGFANPDSRTEAFQAVARISWPSPWEESELRARVRNLLRMKEYHDMCRPAQPHPGIRGPGKDGAASKPVPGDRLSDDQRGRISG